VGLFEAVNFDLCKMKVVTSDETPSLPTGRQANLPLIGGGTQNFKQINNML